MGLFLIFLGFIGFLVFIILSIVSAVRENGKVKKHLATAGALLIVTIIGAILTPTSGTTTTKENEKESIVEEQDKKEEVKKQAELEKEKAEKIAIDQKVQEKQEKETEAKVEEEKQKIPGTLGFKPNDLKDRFNAITDEFKMDSFRINELKVEKGEVQDVAQVKLTENIVLNITINKADGSVRDVSMLAGGDGTRESGTDILLTIGMLITSTNLDLSADERGKVLEDLGLMDENVDILNIDKETVRNNVKYHLMGSEQIGFMFSAGDAREE
ncbi:hypothetical protein ABET41_08085 [Metabacillus fastidiosus]|uniref:Uncharacterized protein n=1 Tax=Metabacillus fastidiosus TaxID=1458 RepID=A0ABU6NWB4_9BACI|nr:hypothetical protein [Metabacillus fastidiosus]